MEQAKIYDIIHGKYDKLLWSIATKISGDYAISSVEDNYQDLWVCVYEAIEGFSRQNGNANGPVETWIGSKDFGRYLKTCLWNKKNHKGKNIATRYNITRDVAPINDEILHIPAASNLELLEVSSDFEEFLISLTDVETEVIAAILDIPNKCISVKGKVKVKPVQEQLGWTRERTARAVNSIKEKLNKNLTHSI